MLHVPFIWQSYNLDNHFSIFKGFHFFPDTATFHWGQPLPLFFITLVHIVEQYPIQLQQDIENDCTNPTIHFLTFGMSFL